MCVWLIILLCRKMHNLYLQMTVNNTGFDTDITLTVITISTIQVLLYLYGREADFF